MALLVVLSILRASRGFGPLPLSRGVPFWSLFLAALTPLCLGSNFGLIWIQISPGGLNIEQGDEPHPGALHCGGHKSHPFADGF